MIGVSKIFLSIYWFETKYRISSVRRSKPALTNFLANVREKTSFNQNKPVLTNYALTDGRECTVY